MLIAILLLSFIFIALFAASEAILAATNRVRLRQLLRAQSSEAVEDASNANVGPPSAGTLNAGVQTAAAELSDEAQRFIATVTIAANVPVLAAATASTLLAAEHFGLSEKTAFFCAALAIGIVSLLQVTPRLLVSQPGALKTAWWVRPARLLVALLRLPVGLLMMLGQILLLPLRWLPASRRTQETAGEVGDAETEEIRGLVEDLVESAQRPGEGEDEKELMESIFSFGDTRVHEVMLPRPDILALPDAAAPSDILRAFQDSGFSRLPIHEGSLDHIVGILHVNDVLRALSQGRSEFVARDLMREPMFLPETQPIDEAFAAMRAARAHLAIAIDEFGGTAGLLTIEDILEELVGDIADEHDRKVEEPLVILDETRALADALLHLEDLEEEWGLALPSGEFDTVGGFVIEQLGRAPAIGDRVELAEATLIVHALRGRRPHKIMIQKSQRGAMNDEE